HTRSYGDWSSDVCSSDLLPISAVHIGVFELDGDALDNPNVAGDDWNTPGGGSSIAQAFEPDGSGNKTIFTGGGSKDNIDISSWKDRKSVVEGKSVQCGGG